MQINTTDNTPGLVPAGTQRGLGSLKTEDFFRILVTELRQQDPFEPAKTSDMINQVAQVRSIELSDKLTKSLDVLAQQQQTAGVSDLIGKFVSALVPLGNGSLAVVEGVVTGVRFSADGAALLELDNGDVVRAADVQRITTLETADAEQLVEEGESAAQDPGGAKSEAQQRARSPVADRPGDPLLQLEGLLRL